MLTSLLASVLLQASVPTLHPQPDSSFRSPATLELTRVRHLGWTRNGRILVLDQSGEGVYLVDSSGTPLAPLARKGSGPGESRGPATVGSLGDTLWIADAVLRRINYYSRDLRFIGSQADRDRCGDLPWAIAPDGRCLILPQPFVPSSDPIPDSLPLLLTRPGERTDTLGWVVMPRMVIRSREAESHVQQVFADDPVPVTSHNGRYFAWVGQRRTQAREPSILIQTRDLARRTSYRFTVEYTPRPLQQDSIAKVLATYRAGPTGSGIVGFADSVARRLYRPQFLPAFAGEMIDDSGRLWLRLQAPPGAPFVTWQVLSLEGTPRFNVQLPAGFQLLDIAGSRLLGTLMDDDDVPSLALFEEPTGMGR